MEKTEILTILKQTSQKRETTDGPVVYLFTEEQIELCSEELEHKIALNRKSDHINNICKEILTITDEEIEEMRGVIAEQKNYIHPFKRATVQRQRALALHNESVLNVIVEVKRLLEAGAPENL
jgi:hypothetical protein